MSYVFPLQSDVYGIFSTFCATTLHYRVTLTFDLLTLAVIDELSFMHSTHIQILSIPRLSVPELCFTQSDHITITCNGHCACAVSCDLSPGVKNNPHFWNHWPIYLFTSSLSRRYDED